MNDREGEFEYIDWIRKRVKAGRAGLGIGDDAAMLENVPNRDTLVAVDMLMDGVHFKTSEATPEQIGHKALAVNLSDIAAMGGNPTAAVVAVCFSRQGEADFPHRFFDGLQKLADEFDVQIVGGDTNTWDGPFVVSVTALGTIYGAGVIRRWMAIPGDWILVTGELGGSIAGHHLSFTPRVREAEDMIKRANITTMIDVSDGLAADLHHILDATSQLPSIQCGANIYADRIPIRQAAREMNDGVSPLDHALGDGEDFELLLTVPEKDARRLLESPPNGVPLTHIGEITDDGVCQLIFDNGDKRDLPPSGWKHGWNE